MVQDQTNVHFIDICNFAQALTKSKQYPYNMPYAAKAKSQQFTRRKLNLMKKADQLARLCQADVALIVRRNGRFYTYRSMDHQQWPPAMSEIVRI